MKNLFERETAGNGPAITNGGAGASPAMRTPRRTGGRAALALLCVLASLAPLVGCELGFGSVLHKPPTGGDDDGGEPGQRYSITYYLNGGTFGSAAAPSTYTPGSLPLTLPEPERVGYKFSGWYENAGLTGSPVTSIPKSSTGDKTFWAKWEEIPYTITLHLNGGDLPSGSGWSKNGSDAAGFLYTMTYTISSGDITLPQAEYPGHSFDGWFDITLAGTKTTAVLTGSTGNKDFYARYPYTVTFDSNGGSAVPGITALTAGATITEPAPPVKGGYDFGGWYKEAAKTNPWDFAADTVNKDTTLYAKWELATYTITYSENGGSNVEDGEYTINSPDITLPDEITQTGYRFMGWYDNNKLTGSPVTTIPTGSYGDKQFWAKWEKLYTITLHLNGGDLPGGSGWSMSGSDAAGFLYTRDYTVSDLPLDLPTPATRAGYEFKGWYGNTGLTGSPVTSIPSGSTGDKTFWAKWDISSGYGDVFEILDAVPSDAALQWEQTTYLPSQAWTAETGVYVVDISGAGGGDSGWGDQRAGNGGRVIVKLAVAAGTVYWGVGETAGHSVSSGNSSGGGGSMIVFPSGSAADYIAAGGGASNRYIGGMGAGGGGFNGPGEPNLPSYPGLPGAANGDGGEGDTNWNNGKNPPGRGPGLYTITDVIGGSYNTPGGICSYTRGSGVYTTTARGTGAASNTDGWIKVYKMP